LAPLSLARDSTSPRPFRGDQLPPDVAERLASLGITLLVRYRRRYYLAADKSIRLTLDTGIRYFAWSASNGFSQRPEPSPPYAVLELKYAPELEDRARAIAQHLPCRPVRHSKYVRGLELARPK